MDRPDRHRDSDPGGSAPMTITPDPADDLGFGFTREGKPRTRRAPGTSGKKPAARAKPKPKPKSYADAVEGTLHMIALPLTLVPKPQIQADGVAVSISARPIAEAVEQLAHERPAFAAVLDRLLAVSPYGALVLALTPLLLQVGTNHGLVPVGVAGTVSVETLVTPPADPFAEEVPGDDAPSDDRADAHREPVGEFLSA